MYQFLSSLQASSLAPLFITLQHVVIGCLPVSHPAVLASITLIFLCRFHYGDQTSDQYRVCRVFLHIFAWMALDYMCWFTCSQDARWTFDTPGFDVSLCFARTSYHHPLSCWWSQQHYVYMFVWSQPGICGRLTTLSCLCTSFPSGACAAVRTKCHLSMSRINVSMATASSACCSFSSLSDHVWVSCGVCV